MGAGSWERSESGSTPVVEVAEGPRCWRLGVSNHSQLRWLGGVTDRPGAPQEDVRLSKQKDRRASTTSSFFRGWHLGDKTNLGKPGKPTSYPFLLPSQGPTTTEKSLSLQTMAVCPI